MRTAHERIQRPKGTEIVDGRARNLKSLFERIGRLSHHQRGGGIQKRDLTLRTRMAS